MSRKEIDLAQVLGLELNESASCPSWHDLLFEVQKLKRLKALGPLAPGDVVGFAKKWNAQSNITVTAVEGDFVEIKMLVSKEAVYKR